MQLFFFLRRVKLCTCPCVCVTVFERHLFMFSDIWPASFPYEVLALQQRSCQCTFRNTQQLHVPYQGLFGFLTSRIQHDSLHNYLCFGWVIGDRISFRSFQVMPLHKILKYFLHMSTSLQLHFWVKPCKCYAIPYPTSILILYKLIHTKHGKKRNNLIYYQQIQLKCLHANSGYLLIHGKSYSILVLFPDN